MARLPIETGSNTARALAGLMYNLGDTRDKGLNALANGIAGAGNVLGDYHNQERAFREAQKQREQDYQLQLQKLEENRAYREADLGLRRDHLEFEKYKYKNPQMSLEDRLLLGAYEDMRNYNKSQQVPQQTQSQEQVQNTTLPLQSTRANAEPINPSSARSVQLSQFFKENRQVKEQIPQTLQNTQTGQSTQAQARGLNTGIAYFDNKENLTYGDLLLAKKMGVPLTNNINGSLNIKNTNVGKSIEEINRNFKNLRIANDMIGYTKDNAGFWNGVDRGLHKATFGVWGLNPTLQNYRSMEEMFIREIAGKDGGKTTDQDIRDARAAYSTYLRDPKNQMNTLGGYYNRTIYDAGRFIDDLKNKNIQVPEDIRNKYEIFKGMRDYIQEYQAGKHSFDYNKWKRMSEYANEENPIYSEWVKIRGK